MGFVFVVLVDWHDAKVSFFCQDFPIKIFYENWAAQLRLSLERSSCEKTIRESTRERRQHVRDSPSLFL
jgi:hypothetical protein